jgi:hypothetical protein
MKELDLNELELVTGGSDTVTGKVKFIVGGEEAEPWEGPVVNSNTTTGTVK